MQKLNILLVSIAFPPKRDPESLQVLKYYTELRKNDLDISVVTSKKPTLFMEVDSNLQNYCTGYKQLIELKIRENKYLNFIKRKINRHSLNYPDSKYTFYKQSSIVKKKLQVIPDIIYSRSFPLSSTFMAYELAMTYNKPWVLHLSDPWTFKNSNDKGLLDVDKWNLKHEELFFARANRICLTSEKTIEFYQSKYPQFKNKFVFSPNVYDLKEAINSDLSLKKGLKRFVYTGGLTKDRNPKFFLDCLKELSNEIPHLEKSIHFDFIGPKDSFVKNLASSYSMPCLSFKEPISYQESKIVQSQADVLVLIDSEESPNHLPVYFPSKILDYMVTRKPILALTPSSSTTNDVLIKYGVGVPFDYTEMNKLKDYLIKCIDGSMDLKGANIELPEDFDAKYNADRLYNLFLQLHAENKKDSNSSRY